MNAGYNGWTNYETWAANLWLSNDEGLEGRAEEAYRNAMNEEHDARRDEAIATLEDEIKSDIEQRADEITGEASLFADLLNRALGEIDYRVVS